VRATSSILFVSICGRRKDIAGLCSRLCLQLVSRSIVARNFLTSDFCAMCRSYRTFICTLIHNNIIYYLSKKQHLLAWGNFSLNVTVDLCFPSLKTKSMFTPNRLKLQLYYDKALSL
jgi:hypothetical protein